jgi:predicted membrane-bound dolichyl-phosphate-mannose-protein mannosyltransferase
MVRPALAKHFSLWGALILVCGAPRIIGAFLLPNAFGDAGAYIEGVGTMSAKLSAGTFCLTDLYGFWLPLYQFICAGVSVLVGHPFYMSKLVSAVFGVGVCLLVYDTSLRLTSHRTASLLTFALIAVSPLHIFNSASAMTDVPHAFFVLAGVACVLRRRWILAALFVALAGLTRMDSWMLIVLIPALQFLEERRVSVIACIILILPPAFWFYLSWKATGDWLDSFVARKQYMDWLLVANPSLAHFSLSGIARDAGSLLLSTDLAVLVACFAGLWLAARRMASSAAARQSETLRAVVAVNSFFFAFLSFLVLAYLTNKQPIIFPRYGLILFALGLPVLPWAFLTITQSKPQWARKLLLSIVVVCVLNAGIQLAYSVYYIRKYEHGALADYLRAQF